jgi:hypothetical protein
MEMGDVEMEMGNIPSEGDAGCPLCSLICWPNPWSRRRPADEKQGRKSSRFQSLVKTLWWLMGRSFTLPLVQKMSLKLEATRDKLTSKVCVWLNGLAENYRVQVFIEKMTAALLHIILDGNGKLKDLEPPFLGQDMNTKLAP